MTWKQALLAAAKSRSGSHVLRAVIVALPALIIGAFGQSLETGRMIGAWMLTGTFLIDIIDDARKARKPAFSTKPAEPRGRS